MAKLLSLFNLGSYNLNFRWNISLIISSLLHLIFILVLSLSFLVHIQHKYKSLEIVLTKQDHKHKINNYKQANFISNYTHKNSGNSHKYTSVLDNFYQQSPLNFVQIAQEELMRDKYDNDSLQQQNLLAQQALEQRTKRQQKIKQLTAVLYKKQQVYGKRLRYRQITGSTVKDLTAAYVWHWQHKIEKVGSKYYSQLLNKKDIFGDVRLLVGINKDGTIRRIEVQEVSGDKKIVAISLKILKLAAPFEPIPLNMSKNTDVLEIIRTWQFMHEHYKIS